MNRNFLTAKPRCYLLDCIRGIALFNMFCYHMLWDLAYLFHVPLPWFSSLGANVWQQAICWTFLFVSGFSFSLGSHPWKRGITVLVSGLLITVVTEFAVKDAPVRFGVLSLIGSSMLLTIPVSRFFPKHCYRAGLVIAAFLFVFTRSVNDGYVGFMGYYLYPLPSEWYANMLTTYLGFPMEGFFSTDYFSLIPWYFLFLSGYFTCCLMRQKNLMDKIPACRCKPLEWLGRHSLILYLIHQPILYLVLMLLFSI